jgi:hypothetical protein
VLNVVLTLRRAPSDADGERDPWHANSLEWEPRAEHDTADADGARDERAHGLRVRRGPYEYALTGERDHRTQTEE